MNSSEEDSHHLSKLQKQNGEEYDDVAEEVEDSGKRKGKQTKESIQRKQKKKKVEELRKMGMTKKLVIICRPSAPGPSAFRPPKFYLYSFKQKAGMTRMKY